LSASVKFNDIWHIQSTVTKKWHDVGVILLKV